MDRVEWTDQYRDFVVDARLAASGNAERVVTQWTEWTDSRTERTKEFQSQHPLRSVVDGKKVWKFAEDLERLTSRSVESGRDHKMCLETGSEVEVREPNRSAELQAAKSIGIALYRQILPDEGSHEWTDRFVEAREEGRGVRIRLNLTPDLELLPWELLNASHVERQDSKTGLVKSPDSFLALDTAYSIVRTGSAASKSDAVKPGRLKVLLVNAGRLPLQDGESPYAEVVPQGASMASDLGLPPDSCAEELDYEGVYYDPDVTDALRVEGRQNTFHLTGHGEQDSDGRLARLLFPQVGAENKDGRVDSTSVYPGRLGDELEKSGIKLAVIEACHAGTGHAWTGFGSKLLEAGVPAVVSMQALLDHRGGDLFCGAMYRALRQGVSLDRAVALARLSTSEDANLRDWWLPVLHTRSQIQFEASESNTESPRGAAVLTAGQAPDTAGDYWIGDSPHKARQWVGPQTSDRDRDRDRIALSSDAAVCARREGGAIEVGLLDGQGEPTTWWNPIPIPRLESVVAVHAQRNHVELLVASDASTTTFGAYDNGDRFSHKRHHGRAVAGGWTGDGFAWIDNAGTLRSDSPTSLGLTRTGLTGLDVGIGDGVRMVATTTGAALEIERGPIGGQGETRRLQLDRHASAVSVVRPMGEAPSMVIVDFGDDQERLTWDDLPHP